MQDRNSPRHVLLGHHRDADIKQIGGRMWQDKFSIHYWPRLRCDWQTNEV